MGFILGKPGGYRKAMGAGHPTAIGTERLARQVRLSRACCCERGRVYILVRHASPPDQRLGQGAFGFGHASLA